MKPHEFWDSTYREVKLYVESRSHHYEFMIKENIMLAENLGNKIITAGMTSKKPKNINLIKEVYPDMFKEEIEKANIYNRKASEGEELIQLMNELDEELKNETKKKE